MKRIGFIVAFLLWASSAWAANSAITGVVTNIDNTTCNNCQVTFNSLQTQVISGTTYQPLIKSTITDGAGNLTSITLPQGLAVQITVSENGQTFPPYTALVPFLANATFNQLNQGITSNPLNVLASAQPPTGPLSMNSQKIASLLCPTTGNDALAWGCNATVANLTVTGTFNQSGTAGENFTGLLTVSQIATPSAPTVTAVGTTGATNYNYYIVCHDSNGGTTLASSAGNVANANATLSATNYDSVAFTLPANAVNCDVLRGDTSHSVALAQTTSPYKDVSNSTSAYTAPTRNTTGDGQFAGALSAGTVATGIATGDLSAARSASTGQFWLGSNGSQTLDFGVTTASRYTLTGGNLTVPTGGINSGTFATGEATGDLSTARAAGTGKVWFGSNGSQSLDFGIANANAYTLTGGGLVLPGALTLTGGLSAPLAIAQGGNGTASPGLTAGTGITLGSTWPTQSIAVSSSVLPLVGTTASFNNSGANISADSCVSVTGSLTVTGATTSMTCTVSAATNPGDPFVSKCFVVSANTVGVSLCNYTAVATTPTASVYNVRVIQ